MWSKPMWLFVISIPPEAVQSVLCNSPCSWGECKKHMEFAANGLSCVTLKKFINLSESQFFYLKIDTYSWVGWCLIFLIKWDKIWKITW